MEEKIDGISIILTNDSNRMELWKRVLDRYIEIGLKDTKYEILCGSRDIKSFEYKGLNIKIFPYEFNHTYYDGSLMLNVLIGYAKYKTIMITCPEVLPITSIFSQFRELSLGNYGVRAWDENAQGDQSTLLISTTYRNNLPGTAFIGVYNKEDLIKVNGFDVKFLRGHSWSDTSFSYCWNKQGIQWEIKDDIQAVHLYHVRNLSNNEGYAINRASHEDTVRRGLSCAEVGYHESVYMYKDKGIRDFSFIPGKYRDGTWKELLICK